MVKNFVAKIRGKIKKKVYNQTRVELSLRMDRKLHFVIMNRFFQFFLQMRRHYEKHQICIATSSSKFEAKGILLKILF